MENTLTKLIALGMVCGVAKHIFGPPPAPVTRVHNHYPDAQTDTQIKN